MKKIIVLALLAFGGYKFYQNGFSFDMGKSAGAFDKKTGKPLVVFFTGPGCDSHCDSVRGVLKQRGVVFEEISVAGSDGAPVSNKYGVDRYPLTLIGKQQILGDDLMRVSSALAEAFGKDVLTGPENNAMGRHFDGGGRAKVVMYGTSWCPYCKQQREFFAANGIAYEEVDVEGSRAAELAYQTLKGNGYPLTYVGYRRFPGLQGDEILAAVKELSKTPAAR